MDFIINKTLKKDGCYFIHNTINHINPIVYLRSNGTIDTNMMINKKGRLGYFRRRCDADRMLRAFKLGQKDNLKLLIKEHTYGPGLNKPYIQGRKAFYITEISLSNHYLRNNGTISTSMEISFYNGKINLGYFRRKSDAQHMLNAYESGQKNR